MKFNFARKPIRIIALVLGIGIIIYGWYNVYELTNDIKGTVKNSYQNAQLNIVKLLALQIEKNTSIKNGIKQNTTQNISQVSEIIKSSSLKLDYDGNKKDKFVNYGDIWFVTGDSKYTSLFFPVIDKKLDLFDYFNLDTNNSSAKHYKELLALLKKRVQGVGWYINVKDKSYSDRYLPWWEFLLHDDDGGKTLVTFTPFTFNNQTWIIGMSTLLPKLMDATGAYVHINRAIFQMLIVTIIIALFLIIIHISNVTIFKLNKKINTLKIEIDEVYKEQQKTDIVESDYFKKIKEIADKL